MKPKRYSVARDRRYTITLEYYGGTSPRHIVRFCGEWLGGVIRKTHARTLANRHAATRGFPDGRLLDGSEK